MCVFTDELRPAFLSVLGGHALVAVFSLPELSEFAVRHTGIFGQDSVVALINISYFFALI